MDDWQTLEDKEYFEWQEFLLHYGSHKETTSDNWLDNVLLMSMETTLQAEVESNIVSIPKQQCGSITTLRCIIKRMVMKNQEAKDAPKNYIREFDITKFPGENVPTACLCLKAIARALGDDNLPSNTIHKVLEGFGKSSTKSFNKFCSSQIALRCGSFYADIMRGSSLQSQLSNLLNDIKATYLDLFGGNSWNGIVASPAQSSFMANGQQVEVDECEARALAAKSNIPWDEWVKLYAKCHHCGEKGHIRPHCPDYLRKINSGKRKRPYRPNRSQARPTNQGIPQARRQNFLKDPKVKAFLSAFNALFDGGDNSVDKKDSGDDESSNSKGEEQVHGEFDEEIYNFLAKVGSLKE
jgi:hypothetical protein